MEVKKMESVEQQTYLTKKKIVHKFLTRMTMSLSRKFVNFSDTHRHRVNENNSKLTLLGEINFDIEVNPKFVQNMVLIVDTDHYL